MNTKHYHTPITVSQRRRCPICDKPVYSSAGVHPQCAIKQNEGVVPVAAPVPDAPAVAKPAAAGPENNRKPRPV